MTGPVLQLRHALDARGRNLVRLSIARSMRIPDTALLLPSYTFNGSYDRATTNSPIAADSVGNGLLRPETTTSVDLWPGTGLCRRVGC